MSHAQNYRFKCRKCQHEFLRRYTVEEFDRTQYKTGFSCFDCGFEKMMVNKSNQNIKDGFQPGWQKNIAKYCGTYAEYKAQLKLMGLVETGFEDVKIEGHKTQYFDPKMVEKLVRECHLDLSGREIEAIENGKMKDEGIY